MSGTGPSVSGLLGHDHRSLDEVFENFQKTPPAERERRVQLLSSFARGLRLHIDIEERDLFPTMTEADPTQKGLVDLLLEDHRRIESALRLLETQVGGPGGPTDRLEFELTNVLWEHNAREENVVYPLLDAHLDPERKLGVRRRLEEGAP